MGSVADKHDQETVEDETGNGSDEELKKPVPDTTEVVSNTADARSIADEDVPADTHNKTRQPIKQTVLGAANQSMRVMSDITDTYERFGKYVSHGPVITSANYFKVCFLQHLHFLFTPSPPSHGRRAGIWTYGIAFKSLAMFSSRSALLFLTSCSSETLFSRRL